MVDTALPAWTVRLMSELEAADRRARAVAGGLGHEQLNWRPRPDAWSIGQCLHHLFLANEVYLPAISGSLRGRRPGVVQRVRPGWFGRWFIRTYIEPSTRGRRIKAPGKIAPAERIEPSILETFLRSNRAAREVIRGSSGFDVNRIRFRNPFIPVIRFTVGTGFEILSKHQDRHLGQAERVRTSPGFPAR